jgi:molecular chaperone GrpE
VFILEDNKQKDCEVTETVEETTVEETAEVSEQPDELEKLQQELAQQKDLLLRTAAEYDNFKKRTQREKEELSNFTKCSVLKELLPALDNFDRSKQADTQNPDEFCHA